MRKTILGACLCALMFAGAAASAAGLEPCGTCHADWKVLGDNHPQSGFAKLDDCTACHAAMKKPVSAKIHSGHLGKTECETCHELKDGSLFVKGSSTAQGKVDESAWELYKEFYAGVGEEKGGFALHLRRGVSCEGCHEEKTPEEMTTVDNAACESCHGTVDEIAAKTVPAVKEQNPHKSHQGNLNCNQCHVGHGTAKSYCLECHQNFNQTMPEAK